MLTKVGRLSGNSSYHYLEIEATKVWTDSDLKTTLDPWESLRLEPQCYGPQLVISALPPSLILSVFADSSSRIEHPTTDRVPRYVGSAIAAASEVRTEFSERPVHPVNLAVPRGIAQ